MNILVINPGSSTVKFELFSEGISVFSAVLDKYSAGDKIFADSVVWVKGVLAKDIICKKLKIKAIGVRVVHGGKEFVEPVRVNSKVLGQIKNLVSLAPLHNPKAVSIIEECKDQYKGVPLVAVFDTSFHTGIPEYAKKYALPYDLAEKEGIGKYGFHGTSHKYMYDKTCEILGSKILKMITCHLGSGSSVAAIKNGKSIDTSMGMTPLDGLVMASRSGDIDPEVIFYLMDKGYTKDQVKNILEKKSGLLGIYGKSQDMREVLKNKNKDPRAKLALDMFVYRASQYIGAYVSSLNGLGVLVFGAGIGEGSYLVREMICRNFEYLGLKLDRDLNKVNREGIISAKNSKVKVFVVHTDEEKAIAGIVGKMI